RALTAAIAGGVVLGSAWLGATAATAAASPFTIEIDAGYGGVARQDDWVPVRVTMRNSGRDFRGSLVVDAGTSAGGGYPVSPTGSASSSALGSGSQHQVAVVLPSGVTKRFTLYAVASSGARASLRDGSGREVASADASLTLVGTDPVVAVLSDHGTA